MNTFNIGDMVRVKDGSSARRLVGRIGTIIEINLTLQHQETKCWGYVVLDIEGKSPGGIWLDEIQSIFEYEDV